MSHVTSSSASMEPQNENTDGQIKMLTPMYGELVKAKRSGDRRGLCWHRVTGKHGCQKY